MNSITRECTTQAANMSDEELIETWASATEEETENLSPLLSAVVEEMGRRKIPIG